MTSKVAWITGGSRGIGHAVASRLMGCGYRVAIGYHRHKKPAQQLASLHDGSMAIEVDVGSLSSIKHAAKVIESAIGTPEVLVNNAGISQVKPFLDINDDEWEHMLSINLMGAVRCSRVVLPGMLKRRYGRIVNISSIGGQKGGRFQVHYAASKAGLINFTQSLANLYSEAGICANAIAPGLIDTKMIQEEMNDEGFSRRLENIPARRLGKPEEVASVVEYLCSDLAGYITGQTINVNGGTYFG
ncbi:MAG: 3-oxoacyl-ACP reductase FabG [Verrucomicrobiota bacterium]|nr:3-oxoacyl-ACP reductase FabG [Verrucomicrobiota bacterium]